MPTDRKLRTAQEVTRLAEEECGACVSGRVEPILREWAEEILEAASAEFLWVDSETGALDLAKARRDLGLTK